MNSATAGVPVSSKVSRERSQQTHMFSTKGVVSLAIIAAILKDVGLTLNRVHRKTKNGQLMFVFERGESQITTEQSDEILGTFLGTDEKAGYTYVVTARSNAAIEATSEVHKGVPAHILLSCTGATPRIGTEQDLRLNDREREMLKQTAQVRLALNNLDAGARDRIPSWVEVR